MDIKLTPQDKKIISGSDDVYDIMQRILLRENKIDREKEHFWIVGMNMAGCILYIELISLGGVKSTTVEPMNVYRVAVMKNASQVIAVHNHPAGTMIPSEEDKDITDRLIQVGKILDIQLVDHMIISTTNYLSFKAIGLMGELEASLKYVPTYQVVEQVRQEEKAIAKNNLSEEKKLRKTLEQQLISAIHFLQEKSIPVEQIAEILNISVIDAKKIINKKQK